MRYSVTRWLRSGLLAGCLTASGCTSVAPVILQCPEIPATLTRACEPPARELATNLDLARAYLDEQACRTDLNLRLEAVRAMAGCRASATR